MKSLQQALLILLTLAVTFLTGTVHAEVTYFHHDAQGSSIAATNETGTVLWRESYEPYGERLEKAASTNDHSTYYTGKPHDDRTGLTYFGARHYDPVVGRFMGIDPVGVNPGNVHSFNRYAYANNNPYKYVDPDGNLPFLIPVIIFIAKEVAADQFEKATGLPALFSVKGVVKAVGKKLGKSAGQKAVSQSTKSSGRSGKQARLREMMNDPKVSSADRGWLKNDARHIKYGNKSGLRIPRNGRKSPGRKGKDKGYELAHPHEAPASKGNSYSGSKLKNHADHKVETRLHRHRY
ncbi:MAG: RHS repeat-associated core domain-containing protein [Candidatus Thiodiazotropha sp. L084R]